MSTDYGITPGEWTAKCYNERYGEYSIFAGDDNNSLALVCHKDDKENAANARAIALVPDMLKALDGIMPLLDSDMNAVGPWAREADAIRDLLAKVRGE